MLSRVAAVAGFGAAGYLFVENVCVCVCVCVCVNFFDVHFISFDNPEQTVKNQKKSFSRKISKSSKKAPMLKLQVGLCFYANYIPILVVAQICVCSKIVYLAKKIATGGRQRRSIVMLFGPPGDIFNHPVCSNLGSNKLVHDVWKPHESSKPIQ